MVKMFLEQLFSSLIELSPLSTCSSFPVQFYYISYITATHSIAPFSRFIYIYIYIYTDGYSPAITTTRTARVKFIQNTNRWLHYEA